MHDFQPRDIQFFRILIHRHPFWSRFGLQEIAVSIRQHLKQMLDFRVIDRSLEKQDGGMDCNIENPGSDLLVFGLGQELLFDLRRKYREEHCACETA